MLKLYAQKLCDTQVHSRFIKAKERKD